MTACTKCDGRPAPIRRSMGTNTVTRHQEEKGGGVYYRFANLPDRAYAKCTPGEGEPCEHGIPGDYKEVTRPAAQPYNIGAVRNT